MRHVIDHQLSGEATVKGRQHVPFSENSLATFTSECSDHQAASKLVRTCQPLHVCRIATSGASGSLMRVPSEFREFGFDAARRTLSRKLTRTHKGRTSVRLSTSLPCLLKLLFVLFATSELPFDQLGAVLGRASISRRRPPRTLNRSPYRVASLAMRPPSLPKRLNCVPLAEGGAHDMLAIVLMLSRDEVVVVHILEVTARVLNLRDEVLETVRAPTIRGHCAWFRVNTH